MYLSEEYGSLSKRTLLDELVWKLDRKIPSHYNNFVHPMIRYEDRLFAFTGNGYLLEISDKDGTWINTYKFSDGWSGLPVSDGQNLYFISRPDESKKLKILYTINLETRRLTSLFTFASETSSNMVAANSKIYFKVDHGVYAVNHDGSSICYGRTNNIENFTVEGDRLVTCGNNKIEGYDLKKRDPIWSVSVPFPVNHTMVAKNEIVYITFSDQLMLLSLDSGTMLKTLRLPFRPTAYTGALKYYEHKLLISGDNSMMIVEDK
jgi:hypothetical protein